MKTKLQGQKTIQYKIRQGQNIRTKNGTKCNNYTPRMSDIGPYEA